MSERFPLAALAVPGAGRPANGACAISLSERRPGSIVEFALWNGGNAAATVIGGTTRPEPNRAVSTPGHLHLSTGPGRFMAIGQEAGLAKRLQGVIPAQDGAVVDVAHGRAGIRVSGAPTPELLQKGLSFDLDLSAFPAMAATNAGLHHMSVTVIRLDEQTFDLFVMTSLAGSLWAWVTDAAVEYGWQVSAPVV
jgi:sarcosine oxidase subunit gamma